MAIRKVNLGIALSQNYDKVTVEILEEPIVFETAEEFKEQIRGRLDVIRGEVINEFKQIAEARARK